MAEDTERSQHRAAKAWHEVAEVMTEQADLLERMERAVDVVKFNVDVVLTQVGAVKAPVKRMERANEFRFDRIDAQLGELAGLARRRVHIRQNGGKVIRRGHTIRRKLV